MGNTAPLFESVLGGIVKILTPSLNARFDEFESKVNYNEMTDGQFDKIFSDIFTAFPSHLSNYNTIIKTITSFSETAPNDILLALATKFKQEVYRTIDNPFTIITINSINFNQAIPAHYHYLRFFTLILLTDLISEVIDKLCATNRFSKLTPVGKIIPCGYHLCAKMGNFPQISKKIIKKWSIIFYKISRYECNDITVSFSQHCDENTSKYVLYLISKVTCTQPLIDAVLLFLNQTRRARTLTADMLRATTILLSNADCEANVLQEFYNLAWSLRSTDGLKNGAVLMLASLFPRLPSERKKAAGFFASRVFKHTADNKKLPRCAEAFLFLIRGPSYLFSFKTFAPCEYAGCRGITENASSDFMKFFYQKADYSICPQTFQIILVQLAAIDFKTFNTTVLPAFLKQSDTARAITLAAVSEINQPMFADRVGRDITLDIEATNDLVRQIILQQLRALMTIVRSEQPSLLDIGLQPEHTMSQYISENNIPLDRDQSPVYPITIGSSWTPVVGVLKSLPVVLRGGDLEDGKVAELLLYMSAAADVRLHPLADDALTKLFYDKETQPILINECLRILREDSSAPMAIRCHTYIQRSLTNANCSLSPDVAYQIEAMSLLTLTSESGQARDAALTTLRRLSHVSESIVNSIIRSDSSAITQEVCTLLGLLENPETPQKTHTVSMPPRVDCAARSDYTSIWVFYLSALLSVLIEHDCCVYLRDLKGTLKEWALANERGTAAVLFYLDSFAEETDVKSVVLSFKELLDSNPKGLIDALPLLNYRVVTPILYSLTSADESLLPILGPAMARLIQNPSVFSAVISDVFTLFLDFLVKLQNHFAAIGVNSPKRIEWTDEVREKMHDVENLAISYCVLVAAVFNNIHDQISEEDWPVSSRQVTAAFLMHWSDTPEGFERLSAFAVNALIPLLASGTIFRDGFDFDPKLLNRLVPVQFDGYPVLDSLLLFHVDILAGEFVRQSFLRPRREANLFMEALLSGLEQPVETESLKRHVGALIIFAQAIQINRLQDAKLVLGVVASLYMNQTAVQMVAEMENLDVLVSMFEFATEQVIEFGLELIKKSSNTNTIRFISGMIIPWFSKIRILPTHSTIANVPTEFRCFNVISFLHTMTSISMKLDEEAYEVFSDLWYELLKIADNSRVSLLVLFDLNDESLKLRIFMRLLEKLPGIVTKFLSKRVGFAYWYHVTMNGGLFKTLKWMIPVFSQAFTEHIREAAPFYTYVLHSALLHHEDTYNLLDILFGVLGMDVLDAVTSLGVDGPINDSQIFSITQIICDYFRQQNNESAIEKWTLEATKWAVCCNNIKLAYRSMIILNGMDASVDPFFKTLLKESTLYFLQNSDDYSIFAPYMGEVFKLLGSNASRPQFAGYAVEFTARFVNFRPFQRDAFRNAMPLLLAVGSDPMMDNKSKNTLLVDAFSSWLWDIEDNPDSRAILEQLMSIVQAPELAFIAAILQKANIALDGTYDDYRKCLDDIKTVPIANRTMMFISYALPNSSDYLMTALFQGAVDILTQFRDRLNPNCLIQITQIAIKRVMVLEEAIRFLSEIADVDPTVASLEYDNADGAKTLDDVITGINSLDVDIGEVTQILSCKQLESMSGIIARRPIPLIYPFAAQVDMIKELKQYSKAGRSRGLKRWSSTLLMSSRAISNAKSLAFNVLPNAIIDTAPILPLNVPKLRLQRLDLPAGDDEKYALIASDKDFLSRKN